MKRLCGPPGCSVDPARAQPHHAIATLRQCGVVGDEHERHAALGMLGEQQIDDLLAGGFVEVSGRLVGHQDRRDRAPARGPARRAAVRRRTIAWDSDAGGRRDRPMSVPAPRVATRSGMPASSSGTATFSSAVMVGIRWNDWNTMPTWRPRKRASASSSRALKGVPLTTTSPLSGRSSPAITISKVDFPEPDGPIRPIASPGATRKLISFRIWTRAAPAPSERLTFEMQMVSGARPASDEGSMRLSIARSYGTSIYEVERLGRMFAHMPVLVLGADAGGSGVCSNTGGRRDETHQDGRIGRFAKRGPRPLGIRGISGPTAKIIKNQWDSG